MSAETPAILPESVNLFSVASMRSFTAAETMGAALWSLMEVDNLKALANITKGSMARITCFIAIIFNLSNCLIAPEFNYCSGNQVILLYQRLIMFLHPGI